MNYKELKKKQEEETNAFPMFFAFDDNQFQEGLKRLGVEKKDLFSIGYGGFIRKSDREAYLNLNNKHYNELKEALKDKKFLFSAFRYELSNHEYCITYDETDALNALGLDYNTLNEEELKVFERAKTAYLNEVD